MNRMVAFRRDVHKHAEPGFKEFETSRKIKEMLLSFGIEEESIKSCAVTGWVVDIRGTGEETPSVEGVKTIALRADMDALPMPENTTVEYKTVTPFAHMCGHDGHMATLLAATQVIMKNRHKIGRDKLLRLLFQPAEEGPGGALPMIKKGCLEGVDEVYGFHNISIFEEGDVRVIDGPIMAAVTTVKIKVLGKGGHGSVPHMINDVITAGAAILNNLHTIKSRCVDSKENFTFTITQFTSGFTYNVFPDDAFMQGTIRCYSPSALEIIKSKINLIAESTAEALGCKAEVELTDLYPPTINHKVQTDHVIRICKRYMGEERVSSKMLPITGSEDFAYFL